MNKLKLFVENFFVYGVGGIVSKIIPLIMVPLITRIMPSTDYYGISDMSNTIIQFASALALMGMYDAMYRMFFEKEDDNYKKDVCSTALVFTVFTSCLVFVVLILMRKYLAEKFLGDKRYFYVIYLSALATLVGATNSIISAPTRMQNKRRVFLLANTISPLISYGVAIPLLLSGLYIIALPIAIVISGFIIELFFGVINRRWFSPRRFNMQLLKKMLVIAVPLLPNFLMYWIFNSSDRLMITNILGIGEAGVYSVGSKLGHCSQLIYTAFAGGWQYFAFSTMKDNNQVESNSKVYEYLGTISFVATAGICSISYVFFHNIFSVEYLRGYLVAPYLFISPLLQMLYQIGNNQFLVIKKTWPGMFILAGGACTNIVLNLLLIPRCGIEGAAIATTCGYIVTCIIDIVVLIKCRLMAPRVEFLYVVLGFVSFFVCWRLLFASATIYGIILFLLYFIYSVFIYRKDIISIYKLIKNKKYDNGE